MQNLVEFTLSKYPTHIAYTNNKKAPNKYKKINGQAIYNGSLQMFARKIAINNIHEYILENVPETTITEFPIKVKYTIGAPLNYGDVSRRKKEGSYYISWKPYSENYEPSSDLDNMSYIWTKAIQDCIVKAGIVPNDTLKYITSFEVEYKEIRELENRFIKVELFKV